MTPRLAALLCAAILCACDKPERSAPPAPAAQVECPGGHVVVDFTGGRETASCQWDAAK